MLLQYIWDYNYIGLDCCRRRQCRLILRLPLTHTRLGVYVMYSAALYVVSRPLQSVSATANIIKVGLNFKMWAREERLCPRIFDKYIFTIDGSFRDGCCGAAAGLIIWSHDDRVCIGLATPWHTSDWFNRSIAQPVTKQPPHCNGIWPRTLNRYHLLLTPTMCSNADILQVHTSIRQDKTISTAIRSIFLSSSHPSSSGVDDRGKVALINQFQLSAFQLLVSWFIRRLDSYFTLLLLLRVIQICLRVAKSPV